MKSFVDFLNESTFVAYAKPQGSKEYKFITGDYSKASEFKEELKANGYSVKYIHTKEVYDYIINNTNCDEIDHKLKKVPKNRMEYAEHRAKYNDLYLLVTLKNSEKTQNGI